MKVTYHLTDGKEIRPIHDIPFKMEIGTEFKHEHGHYEVVHHEDDGSVLCERIHG